MKKCIRTAKEAAIKLVDLIFGDFKAEDKSGINSSFLCLFFRVKNGWEWEMPIW